jgi:hypothetical protein
MDGRSTSFAGQLRPGRSIPSAGIVFRSISTAYPQGRFSGCVSVHMGLLRNRSQAQKTRRFEAAGLSLDRSCEFWTVRDRQKAIPGPLRNPSPPQPPCMRRHPLPVALPDRSAPALYASCSVAKFRTDCPRSGTGKFTGKSEVSDCSAFSVFIAWLSDLGLDRGARLRQRPLAPKSAMRNTVRGRATRKFHILLGAEHVYEPTNRTLRSPVLQRAPANFASARFRFDRSPGDEC